MTRLVLATVTSAPATTNSPVSEKAPSYSSSVATDTVEQHRIDTISCWRRWWQPAPPRANPHRRRHGALAVSVTSNSSPLTASMPDIGDHDCTATGAIFGDFNQIGNRAGIEFRRAQFPVPVRIEKDLKIGRYCPACHWSAPSPDRGRSCRSNRLVTSKAIASSCAPGATDVAVPTHSTFTLTPAVDGEFVAGRFGILGETADVESDGDVVGDGRACAGPFGQSRGAGHRDERKRAHRNPSKLLGGLQLVWSCACAPRQEIRPQELAVIVRRSADDSWIGKPPLLARRDTGQHHSGRG